MVIKIFKLYFVIFSIIFLITGLVLMDNDGWFVGSFVFAITALLL